MPAAPFIELIFSRRRRNVDARRHALAPWFSSIDFAGSHFVLKVFPSTTRGHRVLRAVHENIKQIVVFKSLPFSADMNLTHLPGTLRGLVKAPQLLGDVT